jgi:hypothetical protein
VLVVAVKARHADETPSGAELELLSDFVLRKAGTPVRIEVQEGTCKETALALAKAAIEKLEQQWESLTTQTPRLIADVEDAQHMIAFYGELDELRALEQNSDLPGEPTPTNCG